MGRVNNDGDQTTPETVPDNEQQKADNRQKMDDKRAEDDEKEKAEAGLKVVIDTATLECTLCTNPKGIMVVNYDTPTIQEKKTATVKEKGPKSLVFTGNCIKSPNAGLPCASVMKVGEWKKVGTYQSQEQLVLLQQSTIPCNYGQIDIKITDSGQVHQPDSIEAKGAPVPEPKNEDKKCYCNRDFTPEEMNAIVIELRKGEITSYITRKSVETVNGVKKKVSKKVPFTVYDQPNTKDLLFANQSDIKRVEHLSVEDSSYEKVTAMINKTLKKYSINTCIRKIHFISQAYHESHRFRATFEGRTEENTPSNYKGGYNFQGRGFMQLTHDDTYVKYYNKLNGTKEDTTNKKFYKETLIPFASKVATNLEYAFDSAGWFWQNDDKVNAINVNMNEAADKDDTLYVSQGINGKVKHPNGLEERIKYVADLKKIMNYDNCISKKK